MQKSIIKYLKKIEQPTCYRRAQESRVLLGKINTAKSSVDNKQPKQFNHMNQQARTQSRQKGISRKKEIQLENNALISKMLNIMQGTFKPNKSHSSQMFQNQQIHSYLPGGGVIANPFGVTHSNLNNQSSTNNLNQNNNHNTSRSMSQSQQNSPSKRTSLNYYKRKKDIDVINQTNQQLWKALQNVKPVVNREDFKHHENRIRKLKQHIGQVRYASPSNFIFPQVDQENNNYHSSQFLFIKNPSQLNIMRQPSPHGTQMFNPHQNQKRKQSIQNLNKTYGVAGFNNSFSRPSSSQGQNQQFDNLMNEKIKLKNARNRKQENPMTNNVMKSPQNYSQPQRRLKSRSQIQVVPQTAQSNKRTDLQITSTYTPAFLNSQQINYSVMPSVKNGTQPTPTNPYQSTSAQRQKFVQPKIVKNQIIENTQINIFNSNLQDFNSSGELSQAAQQTPIHKKMPQVPQAMPQPIDSTHKIVDSSIKFIEPKIQINSAEDNNYQSHLDYALQQQQQFYNPSQMNNDYGSSSPPQYSPQFLNNNGNLLSGMNQQKLNFDKEDGQSPTSNNSGNSSQKNRLIAELQQQQQQLQSDNINTMGKGFQRTNTKYMPQIPKNQSQNLAQKIKPKIQDKIKHEVTKAAQATVFINNVNDEKRKRENAEAKALKFIQKLKDKMIQTKAQNVNYNDDDQKLAKNFFGQIFGMAGNNNANGSISVKYTGDSFEVGDQNSYDQIPQVADKVAYEKYLQDNQKRSNLLKRDATEFMEDEIDQEQEERMIIQKAQKILQSIKDHQLQQRVQEITVQFITNLRNKAIENQQKQVIKNLFAKKFAKQPEGDQQQQSGSNSPKKGQALASWFINALSSDNHLKGQEQSLNFIKSLKSNDQNHNQVYKQKSVQEQYSQMSDESKQILESFFKFMWQQAKIRQIKRDFLVNLRKAVEKSKQDDRKHSLRIFKNFANNFMKIAMHKEESDHNQESISIHYTDQSSLRQSIDSPNKIAQKFISQMLAQSQNIELSKEKIFIQNMRKQAERAKHQKQKVVITDEQKARINATKFIKVLNAIKDQRQHTLQLVTQFINYLRNNVQQKKAAKAQRLIMALQKQKPKDSADSQKQPINTNPLKSAFGGLNLINQVNTVAKFANKLKPSSVNKDHLIGLALIKDEDFQKGIITEFKRLFVRLFQLTRKQRESRIYTLYFAQQFKERVVLMVKKAFKKLNRPGLKDEEKAWLKRIQGFIFLNELRYKYLQINAQKKAKEYMYRLRFQAQRKKDLSKLIKFQIRNAQSKDIKLNSMKYIAARLFQQKSYSQKIRYNPFVNNNLTSQQVKLFIADLFQNNRDLIGKPKNVLRSKNALPSYRQVKRFIALQFQQKKYQNGLLDLLQKSKGHLKATEYLYRLKFSARKKKDLSAQINYMMSHARTQQSKLNSMKFITALLFQQKSYAQQIRQNPFENNNLTIKQIKVFIADLFQNKRDLIGRPRNIFKNMKYMPSQRRIRKFIAMQFQQKKYLNSIELVLQNLRGNHKATEYLYRLRFKASQNKNLQKQIEFMVTTSCKTQEAKLKALRTIIARLFQQRSYAQQIRYNPFKNNKLTIKQIKVFIADLFQNKRELVGRPRNIFMNMKDLPSQRQIRRFIAMQFQQKKYQNSLQQVLQNLRGNQKATEYIYRLRFKAQQKKNLQKQIEHMIINSSMTLAEKLKSLRTIVARLFQQKSYAQQIRFNPFENNKLTTQQVKVFIADLFQNKRDLIGRPKNVFLDRSQTPSMRQVRRYVALQFQQKKYKRGLVNIIKKSKAAIKANEYMQRLRFFDSKKQNLSAQLSYFMKISVNTQDKLRLLKYFTARLFQQVSYASKVRYNPFQNNNLTQQQLRLFIADLFQNNKDLVGRPRNIFLNKKKRPSVRQIRKYVAIQFQQKKYLITDAKLVLIMRKIKVNMLVRKFVHNFLRIVQEKRQRQNDVAGQLMQMINTQFMQEMHQDEHQITNNSNNLNLQNNQIDYSLSLGDSGDSFETPMEKKLTKEMMKKFIQDSHHHIKEQKDQIINKLNVSKQQSPNTSNKNAMLFINNLHVNKGQHDSQAKQFIGKLKDQAHDHKIQDKAQQFVNILQHNSNTNQEEFQEKTDQNVKKFVGIFKKNYGRAKLIQDEE